MGLIITLIHKLLTFLLRFAKRPRQNSTDTINRLDLPVMEKITKYEAGIILQWFYFVEDLARKGTLQKEDYLIAKKMYEIKQHEVPEGITEKLTTLMSGAKDKVL